MTNIIKYWKGEEELTRDAQFVATQKNEFSEALPLDEVLNENGFELNSNRRDFLKYFGFSVTAVSLAACYRTPVRKAIPYLVKPESVTPGVADYYSSTCGQCSVGCGVEVKVREGRPIKVDGSHRSTTSKGGLCAAGQAGILSLYDIERLADPLSNGSSTQDWKAIDTAIIKQLEEISKKGERIVILSNSLHGPATLKTIEDFKKKYETAEHVVMDPVSYSSIILANKADFEKPAFPSYNFAKAQTIVSFGADFLGTWGSTVEYTADYTPNRIPSKDKTMSTHIQFESNMSMTGTNADYRFPIKASKMATYVASLYNKIAEKTGAKQIPVAAQLEVAGNNIAKTADMLLASKGRSIVISGSDSVAVQRIINAINQTLENYGSTIDLSNQSNQFQGDDTKVNEVLTSMKAGKVGAVVFYNTNPVYHGGKEWEEAIKKTKLSISLSSTKDETASLCNYVCPSHHYLESWGDAEPKAGHIHFIQPTISPVFNTRQAQESILVWAGSLPVLESDPLASRGILSQKLKTSPYYAYLKSHYTGEAGSEKEFNQYLHDGVKITETEAKPSAYAGDVTSLASDITAETKNSGIDLVLYEAIGVRDGQLGNNPWLQELPDPVSKVTWDNYVSLPKALAVSLGIKQGDTVNLKANGVTPLVNVPALVQPGQANETIGLAVGYGRWSAGKVAGNKEKGVESLGVNAYPFVQMNKGVRTYTLNGIQITKGDDTYELAQTQTHQTIEGRDHVREATYKAWKEKPNAGNDKPHPHIYTIWETRDYKKDGSTNHRWGMVVDLNACTGCGACVVSCAIENNVPVVGRDEVRLRREMHWLRIDRYYSFTNTSKDKFDGAAHITREKQINQLDKAAGDKGSYEHWENVNVVHQPMMCQHCSNAPCETVCPVLATTHSSEGLNQMTYNRCIGTKYCGNNCPYKVRRFNWFRFNDNDRFDFHFNNELGKMVINPDVTVRTRGVMEKCSFCVQRIQEAKLKAKREGKDHKDVQVVTACQRTCAAGAIVFGDLNNPESEISKLVKNERSYSVLEELNVQSSVVYMTKVRNTETV